MLVVFVVVKVDYPSQIRYIKENRENGFNNINIIPFKTINQYIRFYIKGYKSLNDILSNLIGNILVYVPFGLLFPLVFKKNNRFFKVIFIGIGFITFTEIIQFIFMIGYFDIDDIFLNTLGCIIGYTLYMISTMIHRKAQKTII